MPLSIYGVSRKIALARKHLTRTDPRFGQPLRTDPFSGSLSSYKHMYQHGKRSLVQLTGSQSTKNKRRFRPDFSVLVTLIRPVDPADLIMQNHTSFVTEILAIDRSVVRNMIVVECDSPIVNGSIVKLKPRHQSNTNCEVLASFDFHIALLGGSSDCLIFGGLVLMKWRVVNHKLYIDTIFDWHYEILAITMFERRFAKR